MQHLQGVPESRLAAATAVEHPAFGRPPTFSCEFGEEVPDYIQVADRDAPPTARVGLSDEILYRTARRGDDRGIDCRSEPRRDHIW